MNAVIPEFRSIFFGNDVKALLEPSSRQKPGSILLLLSLLNGKDKIRIKMDPGFRRDDVEVAPG